MLQYRRTEEQIYRYRVYHNKEDYMMMLQYRKIEEQIYRYRVYHNKRHYMKKNLFILSFDIVVQFRSFTLYLTPDTVQQVQKLQSRRASQSRIWYTVLPDSNIHRFTLKNATLLNHIPLQIVF